MYIYLNGKLISFAKALRIEAPPKRHTERLAHESKLARAFFHLPEVQR